MPTGHTRVAGVIGEPIVHSKSPTMFNAAFAELGLDWVYVAFPTPRGRGADAVRGMRALGISGLNVTMPHKTDAAAACDHLSEDAQALHAVNTVVQRDGELWGDSTDGEGFLHALADQEIAVPGRSVCVVGAGGAARSIVQALGRAGAEVTVAARSLDAASAAATLAPGGRSMALSELDGAAEAFEVLVNATPVGMFEDGPIFDVSRVSPEAFIFDTVYAPAETPLLTAARAAGIRCTGGIGMLLHQAGLAFEHFTGHVAPLEVMRAAVTD